MGAAAHEPPPPTISHNPQPVKITTVRWRMAKLVHERGASSARQPPNTKARSTRARLHRPSPLAAGAYLLPSHRSIRVLTTPARPLRVQPAAVLGGVATARRASRLFVGTARRSGDGRGRQALCAMQDHASKHSTLRTRCPFLLTQQSAAVFFFVVLGTLHPRPLASSPTMSLPPRQHPITTTGKENHTHTNLRTGTRTWTAD